jgi:hypothetical protein
MGSVRGVGLFALYRKSAFKASPADDIEEKELLLARSSQQSTTKERGKKRKKEEEKSGGSEAFFFTSRLQSPRKEEGTFVCVSVALLSNAAALFWVCPAPFYSILSPRFISPKM